MTTSAGRRSRRPPGVNSESVEGLIADACSYLVVEIENERVSIQPPRFRSRPPRFRSQSGGEARELELRLPARIWRELEAEAEVQGIELPRLVEHASLLYIADLDSGRAAGRILDADDLED